MRVYYLPGAKAGYQRQLTYETQGLWACPHHRAVLGNKDYSDTHHAIRTGKWWHDKPEVTSTDATQPDGSVITTKVVVSRRFAVTKGGPVPTCYCGTPMQWLGWSVTLEDVLDDRHTSYWIHDASHDKVLWRRYHTTRAARDRCIKAALAKAYKTTKEVSE